MYKKRKKRYVKDTLSMVTGGLVIGAGSSALSKMGMPSGVNTHVQGGLSTLAQGTSTLAPIVTMKHSVGMLGDVAQRMKRRKRK